MTVYMKKDNTFYYGIENEYPREDDYPVLVKDYIFKSDSLKLARLFYLILENFEPIYPKVLNYSDPYEDLACDTLEYSVLFTCSEDTRIQLEYILRAGMGYTFLRRSRLLKGIVQGYSIEEWM